LSPSSLSIPPKPYSNNITYQRSTSTIGKELVISGTTGHDYSNNAIRTGGFHCQVSVIVNGVRPSQPATEARTGGSPDYSKWNFVITPKYTAATIISV
jgi:hypothetical protein